MAHSGLSGRAEEWGVAAGGAHRALFPETALAPQGLLVAVSLPSGSKVPQLLNLNFFLAQWLFWSRD